MSTERETPSGTTSTDASMGALLASADGAAPAATARLPLKLSFRVSGARIGDVVRPPATTERVTLTLKPRSLRVHGLAATRDAHEPAGASRSIPTTAAAFDPNDVATAEDYE